MSAFPFFRQPDSMDCGPTCLRMIAKYYGKNISLQFIRERSQIGKEGTNLLGISEAAEKIGFKTAPVKLKLSTLSRQAMLPCILHWDQTHFIVLYKTTKGRLMVADPAHGRIRFGRKDFMKRWSNIEDPEEDGEGLALLLEPTPEFYAYQHENNTYARQIIGYILPYTNLLFGLVFCLSLSIFLQLTVPLLLRRIVDVAVNTLNIHFLYIVAFAQLAVLTGRIMTEFGRNWILLQISSRISTSILSEFLIKIMNLPIAFFDSKKSGDILQRMHDHHRIQSFLTGSSVSMLFALVNIGAFSIFLFSFNKCVFIVFAGTTILYVSWAVKFLRYKMNLDYKRFDTSTKEKVSAMQIIQGISEIKLLGIEKTMRRNWERQQAKLFSINMKALSLSQWQQVVASFINEMGIILTTLISAMAVIKGNMTMGTMLATQYIVGQSNGPILQMIGYIQSWRDAKISMDRLREIHELRDEEADPDHTLQELPMAAEGEIVLSNVSFTFPGAGNLPVLREVSFTIPKGKITAVVGESGSGKTTLLKLLLKYYESQKGEISVNGHSLNDISHKTWRSKCGTVMQESFIFSDTITRNIAVMENEVDMKKLRHATAVANLDDFVNSLPLGLNTVIGMEGTGISTGQRQRILIARAVYRDPEFIFLDEATNSLDAKNESTILNNLQPFFRGRTVIIVAHRLSSVKDVDQIVVLSNGRIVEIGNHRELIMCKGTYHALVKTQIDVHE